MTFSIKRFRTFELLSKICGGTRWVEDAAPDDKVFHIDGVDVYVKEEHLALVNGIEIDFVTEGVIMTSSKPEHIKQESWDEHLRWLELMSKESKANQIKRKREKRRTQGES